jgi:hypothetical protein
MWNGMNKYLNPPSAESVEKRNARDEKRRLHLLKRQQTERDALAQECRELRAELFMLVQSKRATSVGGGYPPIPPPYLEPTKNGGNLPNEPGIYFVWSDSRIEYVGQAKVLSRRVTLQHDNIREADVISYLRFPVESLDFAECYYIGIAWPRRNFGGKAFSHLWKNGPSITE